jgi:hypothetical protein
MTSQEIEQRLLEGESLIIRFGIRKRYFCIGQECITENKFDKIFKKYDDELEFNSKKSMVTEHHYTLKQQQNETTKNTEGSSTESI